MRRETSSPIFAGTSTTLSGLIAMLQELGLSDQELVGIIVGMVRSGELRLAGRIWSSDLRGSTQHRSWPGHPAHN
jgi:hypothetical protein